MKENSKVFSGWLKEKMPYLYNTNGNYQIASENPYDAMGNSTGQDSTLFKVEENIKKDLSSPLETLPNMENYKIINGDKLENILLNRLEFGEDMTERQRLNVVYNLFNSQEAKEILARSGITDVNKIEPGQIIELQSLNNLLTDERVTVRGKTLLNRAIDLGNRY